MTGSLRVCLVIAVIGACERTSQPPPTPAPAPAPQVAPPDEAAEREAACREISHGKSCAEIEPELAALRAQTDAYFARQGERMRDIAIAEDPNSTAAQVRAACADLGRDPITESISVTIPSQCIRR